MNRNLTKLLNGIVGDYKERVAALNISQSEFCRRAGIHENTLYTLKNPRIDTLQRIEKALCEMEGK